MPASRSTSNASLLPSRAEVATRRSRFGNVGEVKTELQQVDERSTRSSKRWGGGTFCVTSDVASIGRESGRRIAAVNMTSRFFDGEHAQAEVNLSKKAQIENRIKKPTRGRKILKTETTPKTEGSTKISPTADLPPPMKKVKFDPIRSRLRSTSKLNNEASSSSSPPTPRARWSRERAFLSAEGESAASTSTDVGKTVKSEEEEEEYSVTHCATSDRRRVMKKVKNEESGPTPRKRARRTARGREAVKVESIPSAVPPATGGAAPGAPTPTLMAKVLLIIQVMDVLYPDPPIPINHKDHFTLLCGVLLSAQTTDAQVNLVTKELFEVAPDPLSMSQMSQEELQQIIRSVGLAPTKAKHLIALSQQLLDRFDGDVPSTFKGLQSLPGVGRKTASVVMSQAFGMDTFPVDTHIHRLALRWGLTKNEKNANKVEEDLMWAFPRQSWSKLHLQFIYFGREHCQARIHNAATCPVCSWVKKTGPNAPKTLSEIDSLQEVLASSTLPQKSSKNAIVYSERHLELEQFRMKLED